jgi:hypothetical protein
MFRGFLFTPLIARLGRAALKIHSCSRREVSLNPAFGIYAPGIIAVADVLRNGIANRCRTSAVVMIESKNADKIVTTGLCAIEIYQCMLDRF